MKKIYISADIEGIWGNSNPANTAKNGYLYSEYCTNMMNEVNLVIDLLFQNGVEEVVVNDSHGNMDNLLPSKLDPRAAFVSANGAYKEFGMMEGLDDSFDGALFIGYHSRCNSPGVMAHTIWGTMVRKIVVDGKELGCVFVETKKTLNNQCALCCSFNELKNRYTYGIQEALKVDEKPAVSSSHTMEITFHHSRNADFVSRMDNVEKMDDCTVRIEKETYKDLYALMRFVIKVCNAYA